MSRRIQFIIAVSVLVAIGGAFFAGMAVQRRMDAPVATERRPLDSINTRKSDKYVQVMVLRDGTLWYKADDPWRSIIGHAMLAGPGGHMQPQAFGKQFSVFS